MPPQALIDTASAPYRKSGLFAYFFARGKLRSDPVYRAILELGLLRNRARILDLGCGQGLLTAWLRAARRCWSDGKWPASWPEPTNPVAIRGVELMACDVERGRRALGSSYDVVHSDIRHIDFGDVDAVVILDVLHYIPLPAQVDVLERVRRSLPQGGLLLLRVGDASQSLRFRLTQWSDRIILLARGHRHSTVYCRSVAEWTDLLTQLGFSSIATPMSHGTPFANVLLVAEAV